MQHIRFIHLQEGLTDIKRQVVATMARFQTKILADLHALRKLPDAKEFFRRSNIIMQDVVSQKNLDMIQTLQQEFVALYDEYKPKTQELY